LLPTILQQPACAPPKVHPLLYCTPRLPQLLLVSSLLWQHRSISAVQYLILLHLVSSTPERNLTPLVLKIFEIPQVTSWIHTMQLKEAPIKEASFMQYHGFQVLTRPGEEM
jgi:hypothetical protein